MTKAAKVKHLLNLSNGCSNRAAFWKCREMRERADAEMDLAIYWHNVAWLNICTSIE